MWAFFDKIYLINLKHRRDRLFNSIEQLHKYKIPYDVWEATYEQNGMEGIYLTLTSILKHSLENKYDNILLLEDDFKLLVDPNDYIETCLLQLPEDYDMFYLGANIPTPRDAQYYSQNLIRVTRALALHAVAISAEGMKKILRLPKILPIDLNICTRIHPLGKTFISNPLIATQYEGFSDVMKFPINYKSYIDDRYEHVLKSINYQYEKQGSQSPP